MPLHQTDRSGGNRNDSSEINNENGDARQNTDEAIVRSACRGLKATHRVSGDRRFTVVRALSDMALGLNYRPPFDPSEASDDWEDEGVGSVSDETSSDGQAADRSVARSTSFHNQD
jgi:hypothetical protein